MATTELKTPHTGETRPYTFLGQQPGYRLNSGFTIPAVGLGTWCEPGKPRGAVAAAVETAIRAGYRHIDCAHQYGNEDEIGEALAKIFKEGVIKRDDLFITSKLWNTDHKPADVREACQRSLKDLGIDYLDLYLMHWPVTGNKGPHLDPPLEVTWAAMEKLVDKGLVRSIGVSNFSIVKLSHLLKHCRIRPAVNQVEMHPYFRNDALLKYCSEQGIHVTAYAPLTTPGHPSESKNKTEGAPSLLEEPLVLQLSKKYNKQPAQILIKWALQRGTSVLPKSTTPEHIVSDLDVFDWALEEPDFLALSSFEKQVRVLNGSAYLSPEGPYRRLSELWDDPAEDQRYTEAVRASYRNLGGVIDGVPMPTAKLSSGYSMPMLGLGTGKSGTTEHGDIQTAVMSAIRMGYRHIDCAEVYGNEHEIGEALACILSEGVVKREELFVCSKLWITDHDPAHVAAACKKSLRNLQLDYLDLYQIHWPATGRPGPTVHPPLPATWGAMEALVDMGLVRSIGVCNFSSCKLNNLLKYCRIKPAVNQVEAHPYFRNDALLHWCKEHDIHVTAYSPLGAPDSVAVTGRPKGPQLLEEPRVLDVARRLGKSPAQVLIRWGLQRGTSVIPKSELPERLKENLDVLSWELPKEDFEALSSLPIQNRLILGKFLLHPDGPYRTLQDLWDEPVGEHGEVLAPPPTHVHAAAKPAMPCAKLNSGYSIPLLGLGTGKSGVSEEGDIQTAVETAIRMGYRHIDCADVYGNEHEIGEALAKVLSEGIVKREELFVCSKLWITDHDPERVEGACRKSLTNLRLDYLDLYQIHWPATARPGRTVEPPLSATWAAMEGLVDKGLVRSVGVCNFSSRKIEGLLKGCRIKPAVNQVESHPYFRNDALIRYCMDEGIHVTAYSPLGAPDSPAAAGRPKAPQLLEDPTVLEVAKKLGKTPAQVLIRWGLQRGTSVVPKSELPERLQENLDVLDWSLPKEDFDALSSLPIQHRMVLGAFLLHPDGPYRSLRDLWDEPVGEHGEVLAAPPPPPRRGVRVGDGVDKSGMPYAKLSSGHCIPLLGLGTGKSGVSEQGDLKTAVVEAIRMGYRHIDCADVYGNEHEIGLALTKVLSDGIVRREELFVCSKLWITDHDPERVEGACKKSLANLNLDYLDLYQIHWPATGRPGPTLQPPLSATWAAMEDLVDKGLVRSIGICNFSSHKLEGLLKDCRIKPAVNQVEAHPYFRNDALLHWCKEHGIHVTAYSPLGAPDSVAATGALPGPPLLEEPLVKDVARRLGKSPAQVLIRWGLQRGTSVVPKSELPERLKENLDVLDWELPEEDFKALSSFPKQRRLVRGKFLLHPEGPYKTLRDLWDEPPCSTSSSSSSESESE